jgi:16S rRNA (cytosine1402-N4)-methyltransferase
MTSSIPTNVHVPVLLSPILEQFKKEIELRKEVGEFDDNYIWQIFDGTLGGGGYLKGVVELLEKEFKITNYHITCCDLDIVAIERVQKDLEETVPELLSKITFLNENFKMGIKKFPDPFFDLIVLDLGFSSNQMEIDERGLSYMKRDEILDMRFDTSFNTMPLWLKLKTVKGPKELTKIIYNSSGEKFSAKIADHILAFIHEKGELKQVGQLVDIVIGAIPKQLQKNKFSIMSRVWQAFRIWVNDELESLGEFLPYATNSLNSGGLCAVVSFHSLEDKIVAKYYRTASTGIELDDYGNKEFFFYHLTKRPIEATVEEVTANIRSRSGVLRILQKA